MFVRWLVVFTFIIQNVSDASVFNSENRNSFLNSPFSPSPLKGIIFKLTLTGYTYTSPPSTLPNVSFIYLEINMDRAKQSALLFHERNTDILPFKHKIKHMGLNFVGLSWVKLNQALVWTMGYIKQTGLSLTQSRKLAIRAR